MKVILQNMIPLALQFVKHHSRMRFNEITLALGGVTKILCDYWPIFSGNFMFSFLCPIIFIFFRITVFLFFRDYHLYFSSSICQDYY
uniref:Uncharacterized protein n=1 Tax=Arundo donax TaxID=35708 RepID=A0A0A9G1Z0_ARUDO